MELSLRTSAGWTFVPSDDVEEGMTWTTLEPQATAYSDRLTAHNAAFLDLQDRVARIASRPPQNNPDARRTACASLRPCIDALYDASKTLATEREGLEANYLTVSASCPSVDGPAKASAERILSILERKDHGLQNQGGPYDLTRVYCPDTWNDQCCFAWCCCLPLSLFMLCFNPCFCPESRLDALRKKVDQLLIQRV